MAGWESFTQVARRLVAPMFAVSLLSGCAIGPDYKQPKFPEPDSVLAKDVITSATAEIADVGPSSEWWKFFGDEELNKVVSKAIAANPTVEAAKEHMRAARAQVRISQADLMPTADGTVSWSRTQDSLWARSEERGGGPPKPPLPPAITRQNNYYLGFEAAWELDFWGKNRRAVEAAKGEVIQSVTQYRAAILSVLADTVGAYFEVLGARESLALIKEEVENRHEFVRLVRAREQSGMASRLDTRRQEVEDARVRAQLPDAEARLARAEYKLAALLGDNPEHFSFPDHRMASYPHLPLVPSVLPGFLARQRPDVLEAEAGVRVASARIGVALGQMLPSVQISGNAGYRAGDYDHWFDEFADEWKIGSALNIPIFDGGRGYGKLEASRANLRESVALYRAKTLGAYEEINSTLVTASKGRERRDAIYEAQVAAADALRIAQEQYKAGLINLLDYLDAQRTDLQAREGAIASDQTVVQDVVNLYRALGGGWLAPETDPAYGEERGPIRLVLEDFPIFAAALPPRLP